MRTTDRLRPAQDPAWAGGAPELAQAGRARGPAWRALLETQWRARLQAVTELSLAYHEAASVTAAAPAGQPSQRPYRPLASRPSASSVSASARRAATTRRSSLSTFRSAGCPAGAAAVTEAASW